MIRGWDQTVPGHNVGSRLVVVDSAGVWLWAAGHAGGRIGGGDTLVFVIDIISTR